MIALTDTATTKVAELMAAEDEEGLVLRVQVLPGGCSGLSYDMYFDTETSDHDTVESYGDVKVAVDSDLVPHLVGATLDYKDGLNQAGFAIDNPNANRTCGCGQSFS